MNKRQRKTFAMYWLVKEFCYSKAQAETMMEHFESWQHEELSLLGMMKVRRA